MQRTALWVSWAVAASCLFPSPLAAQTDLDALVERAKVRYTNVPRKVLAFYYPWYGNADVKGGSGRWAHWGKVDPANEDIAASTNYPALGAYDSHDPKLIAQHCAWAKEAGVDGLIASWWGRRSFSHQALGRILDGCHKADLEATIYYENVPGSQDAQAAADDVLYVLNRFGKHPAWLRVDGKPVVFVYVRALGQIGLLGWVEAMAEVNRRYPGGAVFMGDELSRSAARVFDGIHTYNTAGGLSGKKLSEVGPWAAATYPGCVAAADAFGRISTLTVIPGYDDTKIREPGLRIERYDGVSYRRQWEEATKADPHWILITSWNEWHEGSEIEPSSEDGRQYLDLTAELAARFKSAGRRLKRPSDSQKAGITDQEKLEQVEKLRGIKIGVLPDFELSTVWPLLSLPDRPELVSWEDVAGWSDSSAEEYPVLIYAANETYRQTVRRSGDVDEGLLRYLRAGGFLVVFPSGPMPFYYDVQRRAVASHDKLGLPLSVSGPGGGWEEPPEGTDLRFLQLGDRLPHVPATFPFPAQGDRRWRPFRRSQLAHGDTFLPLVELRDAEGKLYGDAVAYVHHKASRPTGGKVLYVWFGLLDSPHGEALLHDLFAFVGEMVRAK